MIIERASYNDADKVGEVHSTAWKSAYRGIFPNEYIEKDSAQTRKNEFLNSIKDDHCTYLLLKDSDRTVGIVKIRDNTTDVEIESIYILEDYRGNGLGKACIDYIRSNWSDKNVYLWVLEVNTKARSFYERNGFVFTGDERTIVRGESFIQYRYRLTA